MFRLVRLDDIFTALLRLGKSRPCSAVSRLALIVGQLTIEVFIVEASLCWQLPPSSAYWCATVIVQVAGHLQLASTISKTPCYT